MLKERIFIAQKAAVQLGLRSRGLRSTHLIPHRFTKRLKSFERGSQSKKEKERKKKKQEKNREGGKEEKRRKRVSISSFFQEEQAKYQKTRTD